MSTTIDQHLEKVTPVIKKMCKADKMPSLILAVDGNYITVFTPVYSGVSTDLPDVAPASKDDSQNDIRLDNGLVALLTGRHIVRSQNESDVDFVYRRGIRQASMLYTELTKKEHAKFDIAVVCFSNGIHRELSYSGFKFPITDGKFPYADMTIDDRRVFRLYNANPFSMNISLNIKRAVNFIGETVYPIVHSVMNSVSNY